MTATRILCASLFALVSGSGLGCILALGTDDESSRPNTANACSPAGTHSHLDPQGYCTCDSGYGWCSESGSAGGNNCCLLGDDSSTDPGTGDLTPCKSGENNFVGTDGNCYCLDGFDWCTSDLNNLSCCSPDNGETSVHPTEPCTAQEEGWDWCSHSEAMGAEGSTYYVCTNGVWTKSPEVADQGCKDQGFDFAYGCIFDAAANKNLLECGQGPGTACTDQTADTCSPDLQSLTTCIGGRLSTETCTLAPGATCTTAGGSTSTVQACELIGSRGACVCQGNDSSGTDSNSDSTATSDTGSSSTGTNDSTTTSSTSDENSASTTSDSEDSDDSTTTDADTDTSSTTSTESQ